MDELDRPHRTGVGLRERNKRQKRERIRAAALALFEEKGFEQTTTREIAEHADVGIGTLFSYVSDKQDLLFMVFNDELADITAEAFSRRRSGDTLSRQTYKVFSRYYALYHRRIALSRHLLKELLFRTSGPESDRFLQTRGLIVDGVRRMVCARISDGVIAPHHNPMEIAQALFYLYAGEVRRWIGEEQPQLASGQEALRRMLALLCDGLEQPGASRRD